MTKEKKLNRRTFLKVGTTGLFSSIIFNQMAPLFAKISSSGRDVSLTSREFLQSAPSICDLCPAHCGVLGFTQNDFLAAIQGNPHHPNNNGKICARGVAGMNLVHDPERILHPMKRTGKRGEDQWKKISWNDAIVEITAHLAEHSKDEKYIFQCKDHLLTTFISKQLRQFGNPVFLSTEADKNANKRFAHKITWGSESEIPDVKNSRYILVFGANPFETDQHFINLSQRIIQAKIDSGAKLITIDPRLSHTAGRSDDWIPIKPGTDAIVALAMANVIMQENLHDGDFINRWTNISVAALKSHLAQYTLQKAADESSIPAEIIKKIALELATIKPAVVVSGSGVSNHINGVQNERAVLLLNAVIGAIDVKGGLCLPRNAIDFDESAEQFVNSHNYFDAVGEGKENVHTLISYRSNPVFEEPNYTEISEILKNREMIPYHVAVTNIMSETAALADVILPTTIFPEQWRFGYKTSLDLKPYLSLTRPALKPQGESRSIEEILLNISASLGHESFDYQKFDNIVKRTISRVPFFSRERDYRQLLDSGVWKIPAEKVQYKTYESGGFKTKTRRFEIDSTYLRAEGLFSLPHYIPNKAHIQLKKNELILIPFTTNVLTEDLGNSKWLSEIKHENAAWINPRTARSLKLRHGSRIQIESSVGKLEMKVRITSGIHPDAIAISKGLGHWEYGQVAQAKKFKSADPDTKLIWWGKLEPGKNPNILVEANTDPVAGGQAWKDTKVIVKKV